MRSVCDFMLQAATAHVPYAQLTRDLQHSAYAKYRFFHIRIFLDIPVFSLIRTRGSYFFSAPLPHATNGDCAVIGDRTIIISWKQFEIFSNISAHQMLRNIRCTHYTVGIYRHMNACHAPCTLYNMRIRFYTGTGTCGRNLKKHVPLLETGRLFFRTFHELRYY